MDKTGEGNKPQRKNTEGFLLCLVQIWRKQNSSTSEWGKVYTGEEEDLAFRSQESVYKTIQVYLHGFLNWSLKTQSLTPSQSDLVLIFW